MGDVARSAKTGAAIFLALTALAGGLALARGPETFLPTAAEPGPAFSSTNFEPSAPDQPRQDQPRRKHRHREAAAPSGEHVCVRLCDGSFFPAAEPAGGDDACAAQCPDAPVALYTMPHDNIADAVSSTGAPYSALPVANRYQTSFDPTCSCHHEPSASHTADILRDPTLRKGDLVMTADGFKVFEGHAYGAAQPSDFVQLSRATNVSKDNRAALVAMEHSSAGRPTRLRGTVTVDDGVQAASAH